MTAEIPYHPRDIAAELHIPLPDVRRDDWEPRPVGGRQCYPTATSVRFIDASTIVCCSQLARRIYLIRFDLDARRHEILDEADTVFAGGTTGTDLCDIDGFGHVVTSNCGTGGMSLYLCRDDRITFVRDLPTGNTRSCRGAAFLDRNTVVGVFDRGRPGVGFFNVDSMMRLLHVETPAPAKDVCFLSDRRCIVLVADGSPDRHAQERYSSSALLVDFDLRAGSYEIVRQATYPGGQIDAGVVRAGRLYAVDSNRGTFIESDAGTLETIRETGGYNVPHGIDIGYGMMAVTSYGDNSIDIARIPDDYRRVAERPMEGA